MLSKHTFEQAEYVCRLIKQKTLPFGGMQVILCGDFYQLPPVPSHHLGDNGDYCFESPIFDKAFPHKITLSRVYRQEERDLITAISELATATVSEKTDMLLKKLSREIPNCDNPVKIYARNYDVDVHNAEKLMQLTGRSHV